MGLFRLVKRSPIFGSNLAPLIRINTLQLPRADLDAQGEMSPTRCWNRLYWGFFDLNCAQIAPEKAESDL